LKLFIAFGKFVFLSALGIVLLSPTDSFAKKNKRSQIARISTDGAMVYKSPSFDAPMVASLARGKKVRVSRKLYGPFYKVRLRQGRFGYISDIDVKIKGKLLPQDRIRKKQLLTHANATIFRPIFARTYIGVTGASVNYAEAFADFSGSSSITMIGGKYSQPFGLSDGVFGIDFNFLYSMGTPELYNEISFYDYPADGFVIIADLQLVFSLANFWLRKMSLYIGAGPHMTYSDVTVVQNVSDGAGGKSPAEIPVQEARLGVSFTLGYAWRMGPFVLKIEPKYYVDKLSYFGFQGGLQFEF